MLISYLVVLLAVGLLAVSQLSCGLSIDVPTYAVCSSNPACGYLYTADKSHGFCGYLEISCSAFKICGGLSNDLCFTPGEVCISHPRCQSLHVCYPFTMSSSVSCPPIPETIATTTTATPSTTTTTTTTRLSTTTTTTRPSTTTTTTRPSTTTTTTTTRPTTTTTLTIRTTAPAPIFIVTTTMIPVLEIVRAHYSTVVADDTGSGANKDLVIFKPNGGNGWSYLGPAAANKRSETFVGLLVRETAPGILMDITRWTRVWTRSGSDQRKMSLWRADTDPNYVALGDFFVRGDQQPTQSDTLFMKAIRRDFCKEGAFGRQIWRDSGSGSSSDSAIWEITDGGNVDRISAGGFVATPGYQVTSRPVYVLDRNKVKYI